MTTSSEWILASASPRRREILSRLGLKFRIQPSTVPEPPRRAGETAARYVLRAARLKTREIGRCHGRGIVIGADTIVVVHDHVMGKPASRAEARDMLHKLNGAWHEVLTGLCLFDCRNLRQQSSCTVSRVHFRRLAAREIEWYLDTKEYHDKAGAYAIQGFASLFIDRIEGCYFNIVGFPVSAFERLCRRMGIRLTVDN